MPNLPPMPSQKQFLELPIAVQQTWDSYVLINEALINLAYGGWYQQAALLCDATFTDDRVVAVLNTRTNSAMSLPMVFKYQNEGETDKTERPEVVALKQKVTKIVEDNWEAMFPSSTLRELLRWGVMINAGIGELVWRWDHDLLLPTLKTWNPQFIYWRWDTRSIWLIHTGGQVEIHPGDSRWVYLAPFGHNHGQLYGLIRSLAWLWLDRVFTFRNWARAIEKYSLGVTKAFMPMDADNADKQRFQNAITNMPHEATVTLPVTDKGNRFDLEMMKTDEATNWQSYVERIKQLDTSIAVSILGQNLTTEISQTHGGSGGSKAAAKVHDNVRRDLLRSDVQVLASTLKTQVLVPLVYYNFAADAEALGIPWESLVPNVTWDVDPPEEQSAAADTLNKLATAVQAFVTAGAPVNYEALLERFDIPTSLVRRPQIPPPGGNVNERPREPSLMPTDMPSPDYREYQKEKPGARDSTSQKSEGKQQFTGPEGAGQFGNPSVDGASGNEPNPDFRDDKSMIVGQDEEDPIWSNY